MMVGSAQAAGLQHPNDITPNHIVRRVDENEVRLLSKLLPNMQPGALLDSTQDLHDVYKLYWPRTTAAHFNLVG